MVGGSKTIFGLYFLVPVLLAVCLVLLEVGIASRRRGVAQAAMAGPPALLALAAIGRTHPASDLGFLERFTQTLGGSPLCLTLLAVVASHGL